MKTVNVEVEEYSAEKTVFDFEDDSVILSVWIDKYVDDPCYVEDGDVPDDPKLRLNGLACGRNWEAKDGSGWGCMFGHEIIMTHDVISLRDGVRAFANGDMDSFGPFPKKDPYDGDRPFFSLELKRQDDGSVSFHAITDTPGVGVCNVGGLMSRVQLEELCDYYTKIAQWFPPRTGKEQTQE